MELIKYKIEDMVRGFRVWEIRDVGLGYAWVMVDRRFKTREQAEKYIRKRLHEDRLCSTKKN